jgi:hypothetical protein
MKKLMFVLVVLLSLAVVKTSLANAVIPEIDIQPPPWRGQYSTTSQVWEFLTPDTGNLDGLKPDGPAPGGNDPLPSTHVIVTPMFDWIDLDVESGREGIWPLSGWIDVLVDNHEPENEYKLVWVQVVWRPQDPANPDIPSIGDLEPDADPRYPVSLTEQGHVDLGHGWSESTFTWRIYPNPVDEAFTIGGVIDVDALIVDTWCIPEPATVALLGLSSVVLLLGKRRRA